MERHFGSFVWDVAKEAANLHKHGVDFETAARAFTDPARRIFADETHGKTEERLFCIGKVAERILTVRFTYREGRYESTELGIGGRGRRYYEQTGP